jgi:hypothetical protein
MRFNKATFGFFRLRTAFWKSHIHQNQKAKESFIACKLCGCFPIGLLL